MVAQSDVLMVVLVVVLNLTCLNTTMAQTTSQAGDGRSEPVPAGIEPPAGQAGSGGVAPPLRGSSGGSFTNIAPYISVSERYDSNVLFSPNPMSDFVTSIRSGARTQYRNDVVDASLTGGFLAEVYARNPGLNYIGTDASLNANLNDVVGRMVRGLGLTLMDSVTYTPQPPAFVTPEVPPNSFIRGIQVGRNNTLMNNASVISTYALTPLTQFNVSYSHQMVRFLEQPTRGSLFDTTVQSITAGPEYHISPMHSVGVSYQYQHMLFEPSGGGMGSSSVINGAGISWRGSFTRELTGEVSPGVAVVASNPEALQWTMRTLLQWSDSRTTAGLAYTRGLFPSFFLGASALVSDNVTVSFWRRFDQQWSLTAQFDYAHNTALPPATLSFESFGQTVAVNYDLFQGLVASASVTYNYFIYGQGGSEVTVSRETATLLLRKQWN